MDAAKIVLLFHAEDDGYEVNGVEVTTYRCDAFDGKRCTAYADRPEFCSAYPYDMVCGICTVDQDGERVLRSVREVWKHLPSYTADPTQTGIFEPIFYDLLVTYA